MLLFSNSYIYISPKWRNCMVKGNHIYMFEFTLFERNSQDRWIFHKYSEEYLREFFLRFQLLLIYYTLSSRGFRSSSHQFAFHWKKILLETFFFHIENLYTILENQSHNLRIFKFIKFSLTTFSVIYDKNWKDKLT